ncbi:MAG: GAF domain-containing sensor histidine kinase [Capsulimonadaceae bacterium]
MTLCFVVCWAAVVAEPGLAVKSRHAQVASAVSHAEHIVPIGSVSGAMIGSIAARAVFSTSSCAGIMLVGAPVVADIGTLLAVYPKMTVSGTTATDQSRYLVVYFLLGLLSIVALSMARLAARIREEARQTAQRENETAVLYQAIYSISREVHVDRLLPVLVEQVTGVCGATDCLVFRNDPDDEGLSLVAGMSGDAEPPYYASVLTIAGIVLDRDICVGFGACQETWAAECRRAEIPMGDSAGLYVPLHVLGRIVGVMYVHYRGDGQPFCAQHERLILTLANHAAVVIARLAMGEEAQRQARNNAVLDERNRLARDVHDSLSHTFTGIKFLLEAADRVAPSPQALECMARARDLAIEGAQEARRSVWALRAAPLDEGGDLPGAIRAVGERFGTGLPARFEVSVTGAPRPLQPAVEEDILRTCQEAVGNAIRHARASCIQITLAYETDCVSMSVVDDGCGFDAECVSPGKGLGLTSMRDRCARIGAEFCISGERGRGTRVRVSLPIVRNEVMRLPQSDARLDAPAALRE